MKNLQSTNCHLCNLQTAIIPLEINGEIFHLRGVLDSASQINLITEATRWKIVVKLSFKKEVVYLETHYSRLADDYVVHSFVWKGTLSSTSSKINSSTSLLTLAIWRKFQATSWCDRIVFVSTCHIIAFSRIQPRQHSFEWFSTHQQKRHPEYHSTKN